VLVEGQWLDGFVAAVDGHGLVLATDSLEHSVIRMDSISAVRVLSAHPERVPEPVGAHPMPGPRLVDL